MQVDRAHYCPDLSTAYSDAPQPIGHRATISAPHMHASAAESILPYLDPPAAFPTRSVRVLDIGSGSGYLTHVLAELAFANKANKAGEVVGVEHISQLTELGRTNMAKSADGRTFLEGGRVKFVTADGRNGHVSTESSAQSEDEGWDAIHVGAAAKTIHPELIEQLRKPGRMFIPVDDDEYGGSQHIWLVDKDEKGEVRTRKLFGVTYVPLTDAPA
ncbi:MAG: hypothetical protein M1818_007859 [Claussenomyces sp. TS43310]|nr:MAG: hypothetical protein M1818_007859 [Claussenomyces sp. TS43310]